MALRFKLMTTRRAFASALVVIAGLAMLVLAAPTQAAAACSFDATTGDVTLTYDAAGQELRVTRLADGSIRFDEKTGAATDYTVITCTGGVPTVTTTERILATGTAANNQDLRIDLSGGPFGPGKTAEATGTSEIEFVVDLGEAPTGQPADSGDGVIVSGAAGADTLAVGVNGFKLNGDDDLDVSTAGVEATAGDRQLLGSDGDDTLSASGDSVVGAGSVAVTLNGGNGLDALTGGSANDTIAGGAGNDTLTGGAGNDTLTGDAGNDTITGGDGNDSLTGGAGNDTLTGDAGNDTLIGGDGNDTENGGAGDDVFEQFESGVPNGADVLNGGAGTDEVRYGFPVGDLTSPTPPLRNVSRDRGVVVTLDGVANDGEPVSTGEGDNVGADGQVENVVGTLFNDTLTGNAAANVLSGGAGRDTLNGMAGNDTLRGGADDDIENGGEGDDTFDQEAAANGADVLNGGPGNDTADYARRLNFVTVTTDGVANDGEAGEKDNVVGDVEASPAPGTVPAPGGGAPDPRNLSLVGRSDLGGGGLNGQVALVGTTAVVAGGYVPTNTQSNAHTKLAALNTAPPCATVPVKVVDLSDPSRPRVASTIPVSAGQAASDVDVIRVNTPSFKGDLAAVSLASCTFDETALRERGLALQGSYAHRGVVYYDVSNPAQPRFLSRYFADFDNFTGGAAPPCGPGTDGNCAKDQFSVQLKRIRDGRILSVSSKPDAADINSPTGDVRLVDVTNPADPVQVGSWPALGEAPPRISNNGCYPRSGSRAAQFSSDGTRVMVPHLDGGLYLLDVLDLANPKVIGQWNYPMDWNVEGQGARVAQADVGGRQLALLSDEDWWWPTSAFRVDLPTSLSGLRVGCSDLFTIFDFGGPRPFDAQIYRQPGGQIQGEVVPVGRACPAAKNPDGTISTPADPYLVDETQVAGKIVFANVSGGCTFNSRVKRAQDLGAKAVMVKTAGGGNPLTSPPGGHAESIAGFPPVGTPRTEVDQNLRPTGDLSIPGFQLKQPDGDALQAALCPTTSGTPPRCSGGTPIVGSLVDLPGEWGGLRVLDITNPAKPSQTAVYRTPNSQVFPPPDYRGIYSVHHAVVQGETAYVAWNSDGLRVLDLRNGQTRETFSFVPEDTNDPTGTLPAKAYVQGVAVSPNLVVISDVNSGLYVFCFAGQPCPPPLPNAGASPAANSVAAAPPAQPAASASPIRSQRGSQRGQTRGPLPATGADSWKLLVLALVLIAMGTLMTIVARRRSTGAGPPASAGPG